MLNVEEWMDIRSLHKQGHSIKAIARRTGASRNTIRRVIRATHLPKPQRRTRGSGLDAYKPYLEQRYRACALSAVRLHGEIVASGYEGSVATVRRFVSTLRQADTVRQKLTVRFETPPGQQAQIDWAYCGKFANENGQSIAVYAFVMVLGFSRAMYVEFVDSMRLPVLLRCHQNAFAYFGGWPHELLYDNMKQVRLNPATWNPGFLNFVHYYGITPKTHRIYRARTKGKVERMVLYVKDNFLNGRTFADFSDLNGQAVHWLNTVANVRQHQTTQQRPVDLLPQESLTALTAITPYVIGDIARRRVDWNGLVQYRRSRYSTPPRYAGRQVEVICRNGRIQIQCEDLIIAEHLQATMPAQCIVDKTHIEALWQSSLARSTTPLPAWQQRASDIVAVRHLSDYEVAA